MHLFRASFINNAEQNEKRTCKFCFELPLRSRLSQQAGRNNVVSCFALARQRAGHARMFMVEQTGSCASKGAAPGPPILLSFQAQPPDMRYAACPGGSVP